MKTALSSPSQILHYIDIVEKSPPNEELKQTILEVWRDLKALFEDGDISIREFTESQSRLWSRREEVSEAMLPASQRERTGKIF